MRRSRLLPWLAFVLCAIVPVTFVAALGWRARLAAVVDAREAEAARRRLASSSADHELDTRLAAARRMVSALPEGGDPLIPSPPPSMITFDAMSR